PNDAPANALLAVEITSLPTAGTLTNNGVAVTAGQFISAADIAGGRLKFTPPPDAHGSAYANLTLQVQDDGGTPNTGTDLDLSPNTLTVDVAAVNDAPSAVLSSSSVEVHRGSGAFVQTGFATGFTPGPATATDEAAQTAVYELTNTNNAMFRVQPA